MRGKPRKYAFFTIGGFSGVNANLIKELRAQLPEFYPEVIDVGQFIPNDMMQWFRVATEYGWDLATRRRSLAECRQMTTKTFKSIRDSVRKLNLDVEFTLQTQSLFDASLTAIPHFVYTDHTVLANYRYRFPERTWIYHPDWISLEFEIYHNAMFIFTTSDFASRSVIEDYGCDPSKVGCIYLAGNIRPAADYRTCEGDKLDSIEILFVGDEWERKGGPDLVAAYKQLRTSHPHAKLNIIGCNPRVDCQGCEVLGWVSDVGDYFRRASLFCLPSRVEPAGIVLTEAAAFGLPIVTTSVGGNPDLILHGQSGLIVEPLDVPALSNSMALILESPELSRRLAVGARTRADTYFSWHAVARSMKTKIMDLIGN